MYHRVYWTPERMAKYLELIAPLVYRCKVPLPPFRAQFLSHPNHAVRVLAIDVDDHDWPLVEPNSYWGHRYMDFVLRTQFRVPEDWPQSAPVALYLPLGEAGDFSHPEALVWVDGRPVAACDRHHQEVPLPAAVRDGEEHVLTLHGWTGLGGLAQGEPHTQLFMRPCYVVLVDEPTRELVALIRVTLGVVQALDPDHPARSRLLNALDAAWRALDTREPLGEAFYASVPEALAALRAGIAEAGSPVDVDIFAVGHAHIDVAWLWPLAQTRQKARRTFYTVLRLMEAFPEYHFTQSQPQLYAFVQEDDPELFAAIRQRVAEGRWEPIGGMWVEPDCNITGAESLVRQFLLGRRFFREHFGPDAESPVVWLPDTFGFPATLPQLIRQAGLKYFFTIKLSWNQYNAFPYDTFWWEGLDGSCVLAHISPTPDANNPNIRTYNALVTPEQVIGTWQGCRQKELHKTLLMVYGHGDGGGGPTREMLENARVMAAFPAVPRVRPAKVIDFFRRLEQEAGPRAPVWRGELYLELHRGTYTTHADIKRANRKAEVALHDAEFLASLATLADPDHPYPHDLLREAWQLVCLNQFHDILPGSSVTPVYQEARQQYQRVQALARQVIEDALETLSRAVAGDLIAVNPAPFARDDLLFWEGDLPEGSHPVWEDGMPIPYQRTEGGVWLDGQGLPGYTVRGISFRPGEGKSPDTGLRVGPRFLENRFLRVEFNDAGDIVRIFDKEANREVLPAGAVANQFQAFEDRPLNWDAWDIDLFHELKMWMAEPATAIEVVEAGPLRATLRVERRILNSTIVQDISLMAHSRRIDFATRVDWRDRHVLLKVAFPVEILASTARYEIQWGHVERPTHRNTLWDWARFEAVAHKWVDLSEGNYGVSLLNDCKYGHDVQGNVLRLTLLRSPTLPDPTADQGEHRFTYSLFPHPGGWDYRTVAAGYLLNDPAFVHPRPENPGAAVARPRVALHRPFVAVDRPEVVVETIKWAEDGNGLILRLYDAARTRGPVRLTFSVPLQEAARVNLLEEDPEPLPVAGSEVIIPLRPFEIVTLRLRPRG